jgi:hypothetical protein
MSTAFAYFDGERGHLTMIDDILVRQIVTLKASPGRVIQIDDGKHLRLLRYGFGDFGVAIKWGTDPATLAEKFAKDTDAKLYPTQEAYDRAVAKVLGQKRGK